MVNAEDMVNATLFSPPIDRYYLPVNDTFHSGSETAPLDLTDPRSTPPLPSLTNTPPQSTIFGNASSPSCSSYSPSNSTSSHVTVDSNSFSSSTSSQDIIQLYREDPERPILMQSVKTIKDERLVECIFDATKYSEFLNTSVPQYVEHEVVFLIDTSKIANPKDCLCDSMGSWKNCGTRVS
jgi:hypothetical protein